MEKRHTLDSPSVLLAALILVFCTAPATYAGTVASTTLEWTTAAPDSAEFNISAAAPGTLHYIVGQSNKIGAFDLNPTIIKTADFSGVWEGVRAEYENSLHGSVAYQGGQNDLRISALPGDSTLLICWTVESSAGQLASNFSCDYLATIKNWSAPGSAAPPWEPDVLSPPTPTLSSISLAAVGTSLIQATLSVQDASRVNLALYALDYGIAPSALDIISGQDNYGRAALQTQSEAINPFTTDYAGTFLSEGPSKKYAACAFVEHQNGTRSPVLCDTVQSHDESGWPSPKPAMPAPPSNPGEPDPNAGSIFADESRLLNSLGQTQQVRLGNEQGSGAGPGSRIASSPADFQSSSHAYVSSLAGTPLRMDGQALMERIFDLIHTELGEVSNPLARLQTNQGVLSFNMRDYAVSALPVGRIHVDLTRSDGVYVGDAGHLEFVTGNLVTTFSPSVEDPAAFAQHLKELLPGVMVERLVGGAWHLRAEDGSRFVARPDWGRIPDAHTQHNFVEHPDGMITYHHNGYSQAIWPEFYDYAHLRQVLAQQMNDPDLRVQSTFSGSAIVYSKGDVMTLRPDMHLLSAFSVGAKPQYWTEGEKFYIKYPDGSAQGFIRR